MARRSRLQEQESRRDWLRRHRGDADSGYRQGFRPCDDAAAFADLFQDRTQHHRNCRNPARAAGRRNLDSRNHPPENPVRSGRVHPQDVRRAGSGQERTAVRGRNLSRPRLRYRDPLHAEIPAVAAADRVHSGRRSVPGHQGRQGLGGDRRNRAIYEDRHSPEVRHDSRSRHHRHRDRLQSERQRRHRF